MKGMKVKVMREIILEVCTRNTREKIPELEMIDQSTGGDPFLMFLGQGRSEFA